MSADKAGYIRVVTPETEPGHITKSQGTRVLLPDGSEIPRISKIELVAEAGDVWRATLHTFAAPSDMPSILLEKIVFAQPNKSGEITILTDDSRRFARSAGRWDNAMRYAGYGLGIAFFIAVLILALQP